MAGRGSSSRRSGTGKEDQTDETTYEAIIGVGATGLSSRLAAFRQWLAEDAKIDVHAAVCIVNGEATDGTRNAPVLIFGPPPSVAANQSKAPHPATGRCGIVDTTAEHMLYDRTMGCQIRTVRELKKGDVMMTVPRSAMITPALVASSSAGRAVLACCQSPLGSSEPAFWDAFENTELSKKKFTDKLTRNRNQLLVKVLQERKKAETALSKAQKKLDADPESNPWTLAPAGTISTRAPLLAFLIHQRFSDASRPFVFSEEAEEELSKNAETENALHRVDRPSGVENAPTSFGPYARTLPSAISLPMCWKRNELALLASCYPGLGLLQEVATTTLQLASEFVTLVDAGITHRFPTIFPPGLITWDRWVWAAAVYNSRVQPVERFLNAGEDNAIAHFEGNAGTVKAIKDSPDVWNDLGVLIPLFDMINHENEASQVEWEPCVPERGDESVLPDEKDETDEADSLGSHGPRAMMYKRVKKGSQVYSDYKSRSNQDLMLNYGFAQMGNTNEEIALGWCLGDAVGNVPAPSGYTPPASYLGKEGDIANGDSSGKDGNTEETEAVYESSDADGINAWWTSDRLSLLGRDTLVSEAHQSILKAMKKIPAHAYVDGRYSQTLLMASVVGTMPPQDVERRAAAQSGEKSISKTHQRMLRKYLCFFFTRKLEKLLENLNAGLKDLFGVQLWTKASDGGLQYNDGDDEMPDDATVQGWQSFFDSTAYTSSLEVEKMFYAMGPDSCALTLYDGQLRALQSSLDGVSTEEKFANGVLSQLEEAGFIILQTESEPAKVLAPAPDNGNSTGTTKGDTPTESKDPSKSPRRRNKKKGERPPATKLHIGNLAYTTSAPELFEFFANLYGRDNVLECHIPTERESGRSRGFGFVTMPESIAAQALQSGRKHEIDGRLLKVAQSNSAGSNSRPNRVMVPPPAVPNTERCGVCGYRPRYCVCANPSIPRYGPPPEGRPSMDAYSDPSRDRNYYEYNGPRHGVDRRRRSHSRSPSYERGGRSRRDSERDYDRDYGYDRSRSGSYSRGRDKDRSRRERERRRSRSRERGWDGRSSHGRSRYSRSRSAERSRSYSGGRSLHRDKKGVDIGAEPSRQRSPNVSPRDGTDRKRDGSDRKRSRSRSRSRGKSNRRKRSSKRDGSRRHGRSRSRSPRGEKL